MSLGDISIQAALPGASQCHLMESLSIKHLFGCFAPRIIGTGDVLPVWKDVYIKAVLGPEAQPKARAPRCSPELPSFLLAQQSGRTSGRGGVCQDRGP